MRIELSNPSGCVALRDYFLRLGAVAVLGDDSSVDVHFPDDPINAEENIETYLRSWVETNRTPAAIGTPAAIAPQVTPSAVSTPSVVQPIQDVPVRLGDLLVAKGFITQEQLAYALVEAREQGELLGRLLLRYEWVFESELARTLAEQWGLPYLNLASVGVNRELLQLLPREVGLRAAAIPVRRMEGATQVAFADPADPMALAAVREHIPSLTPAVAELTEIENAWRAALPAAEAQTAQAAESASAHAPEVPGRPKIGELFLKTGRVTQEDLDDALREQTRTRKPLGEILVARGVIDRLQLASALTQQWSAKPAPQSEDENESPAPDNGAATEVERVETHDGQLAELQQAVASLAVTVERLRADIEEKGRRRLHRDVRGFSTITM